jgi:hypothetical protein
VACEPGTVGPGTGGEEKEKKGRGVLEGGAMCGVLCLRRCGDRDGIGRYNIIQDNFFSQ